MTEPATTPEAPWPVRTVARKIAAWIDRLGTVWVEGQITQISAKAGTGTAFLTLRDPAADVSVTLTCPINLVRDRQPPLADGCRVVVRGKPSLHLSRGTLSLRVDEIRAVGIGELLARIERLRRILDAEGLFDPRRKRRLPLLPGCVGLITG
ncbi:MAG: exodeoxyribonuclease VII large subunit, partial [Pseudonocardiaceae bacterium]